MTDLDTFKRRVGYRVQAAQDSFTGNDDDRLFQLTFENISDVVVQVDDAPYPTDRVTVDAAAGLVKLPGAPGDGSVISITYKYAPFTDDEANELIAAYGLDRAVIEALREILANTARLRNYKQGDTEVDNSQVFKQVKQLLDHYVTEYQSNESAERGVVIQRRNDPRGGPRGCRDQDTSRLYG
jgi:hypothetical protein